MFISIASVPAVHNLHHTQDHQRDIRLDHTSQYHLSNKHDIFSVAAKDLWGVFSV
jgi:hypothetical protein